MTTHLLAITTTDAEQKAITLSSGMVEAHLAACVQIVGPIRSIYRWESEIQNDTEYQLWIKTTADRLEELKTWISEHHDYDVPELVALPVLDGCEAYLKWVTDETR